MMVITGLELGGAEMMLLKLVSRLRGQFSIQVVSLTSRGVVGERLENLDVAVTALDMRSAFDVPRGLLELRRVIRQEQPAIVHTWMYHADLLGGIAARLTGVCAVVWCIRNSTLDADTVGPGTRLTRRICALLSHWIPDRIVSCSQAARDIHVQLGYKSSILDVIPNGFELAEFRPDTTSQAELRTELALPAGAEVVGLIGRDDPQKDHETFIQAAGILRTSRSNVHFLLAGAGIDSRNQRLLSLLDSSGLRPFAHLLGLRRDVPRILAGLDVLASSSSYGEAFPNIVGEAMACGVPCVVTDVGDSGLVVGDAGIVVPPRNAVALAGGIESLLQLSGPERERIGQKARRRVAESFDMQVVAGKFAALYVALINERSTTETTQPSP
jgi:glycosyltransferase involved in cell wall biosynthesis